MHVHVSAVVKLAFPGVNEPYAHQSRTCDSRNYRRVIVIIISHSLNKRVDELSQ